MPIDTTTWLIILSALLLILLIETILTQLRLHHLQQRYNSMMNGVEGQNLQQVLETHLTDIRNALRLLDQLTQSHQTTTQALEHCIRAPGIVRYNPFPDVGGDQSFSIALTDTHGNGCVLTSLYRHDTTRIYAKPLQNWTSTYPLTDEEQEAIALARQQHDTAFGSASDT